MYVFKPGQHGPDAPPLAPASASSRSAPRARRAARARHEALVVTGGVVASGTGRRALCGAAPNVKPATRPDPPGPSAHRSLGVIVTVTTGLGPEGPDKSE
jgi:hypothetical protein